jgi:tetratricopeptide (TPR) repeat protein
VNLMLGKLTESRRQVKESFRIFEELGNRGGMGWALETSCRLALRTGDGDGFELASRARQLFAEVHDRRNDAWVLLRMAESHLESGWLAEARAETDQALTIFTELNDKRGIGYAVTRSGLVELADRRFDEAGAHLRRALRLFLDLGDEGGATTVCGFLAALAVREGDRDAAVGHAEQWLSVPAADRYVWSYLDAAGALVAMGRDAGYDAAPLESRHSAYAAVLREEGDGEAAEKLLDDIPEVLAAILDAPSGAGP